MFHNLSCFNLAPDVSEPEFQQAIEALTALMKSEDLLLECGALGRRQRHPVMDTDSERNLEYYFLMSFRDREQCDRAVAYIKQNAEPGSSSHAEVFSRVRDGVFICWEDLNG